MKRTSHKRFLAIITMLILLQGICFSAFFAEAKDAKGKGVKANADFKVEMEYGIDGFAVYDNPAVVKVKVESRNNFAGTLRIIPVVDSGQKIAAYGEEISLAAGEAKTFTFIPSSLGNSGKIKIELLDEKEKLLYSESRQLTMSSMGNNVTVGILSDDYSALNYFDGISMNLAGSQGMMGVRTLELTKDSMLADSGALSVLNYIILDNFDTASLSDGQYKALKEWVNNGGVLVLALGSNYQNILHCFTDDFITGTLGKVVKKNIGWEFLELENSDKPEGENTGEEDDTTSGENDQSEENPAEGESDQSESDTTGGENDQPDGNDEAAEQQTDSGTSVSNVECIEFAFTDATELSGFSDDKTAYQKRIGAGRVVVLSYALGMEPVASCAVNRDLAKLLLETSAVDVMTARLNGSGNMSAMWYSGINLAKAADESKKPSALLYGSILLIYVTFVGPLLYLILKAVKRREKIWIAVPVTALVFTGIIYLTGFIYRIRIPLVNTFSLISLEDEYQEEEIYTNVTCPRAQKYKIKIKEGYTEFQHNFLDYTYSRFGVENSHKQFDYMINKAGGRTELTLNNSETFQDTAFAVKKSSGNDIGTIDCDLKCYTTGFEGTITNNTKYDLTGVVVTFEKYFYQAGDMKKGEQITIDTSKLIESMGYGTFEQIYNGMNRFNSSDRKLYRQYQIDTSMESGFVNTQEYNKGYVWASVEGYKPDFIEEAEVKQSGIGVVFETYEAEYEDVKGVYYSSLNSMIVSSQGEYDAQDGMIYNDAVTITYSFENSPGITALENLSFGEEGTVNGGSYARVSAYNPETGDYDLIFADGKVLSGEDLKKYMSGNIIVLRYDTVNTGYSAYIPRIIARGDE